MTLEGRKIILGVTGGIAAFKAVLLLRLLTGAGATVRVVMTPSAAEFIPPLTFEALSGHPVHVDIWSSTRGGGEAHIELAQWAELVVVGPATANFMAEQVQGMATSMLGLVCLACPSPLILAPAMHEVMWYKPSVQRNCRRLTEDGVLLVGPVAGDLASGAGMGRMADPEVIFSRVEAALSPKDLAGKRVIVSAGPTREALDPVRFLSNASTGRMGYAIARAASMRGAEVTLVSGPTSLPCPDGVRRVDVVSAADMYDAMLEAFGGCDLAVMSAAVADYTPARVYEQKVKKSEGDMAIPLSRTRDILATLGRERKGQIVVGFAMETEDLIPRAQAKLEKKACDLIVANSLVEAGAGFGHSTNKVSLVLRGGEVQALPLMSKAAVAHHLLDVVSPWLAEVGGGG